jgi:hypothetical protein
LSPVLLRLLHLVKNKDGGSEELRRRTVVLAEDEGDLEDKELLGYYRYFFF